MLWTRRSQLFFSSLKITSGSRRRLLARSGCRKVFSKGTYQFIAPEGGKIRALTHILKKRKTFCQLDSELFQGWFRRLHCEAHGFEESEKLQHRTPDSVLHCRGRLSNLLCDFKIGHPGKECEFDHSVLQRRDCIQRCSNESPLFCDVD